MHTAVGGHLLQRSLARTASTGMEHRPSEGVRFSHTMHFLHCTPLSGMETCVFWLSALVCIVVQRASVAVLGALAYKATQGSNCA